MTDTKLRIGPYAPRVAAIAHDSDRPAQDWERECSEIGGFNPKTGEITKICCVNDAFVGEHLDHIAAAVEAGVVHRMEFVQQLFASNQDFVDFVEFVSNYQGRIHDRWHRALLELAGLELQKACLLRTDEIVSALRSRIS